MRGIWAILSFLRGRCYHSLCRGRGSLHSEVGGSGAEMSFARQ